MRRTIIMVLGIASFLSVASAADEAPPSELAAAVSRLAAAMEHLSAAMEKEAATASDARNGERVQVAVGILGLRLRKVERLEGNVLQLKTETDDLRNQIGIFKTQFSDKDDQRRQEGRDLTDEEKAMRADMERGMAMAESRIKTMEERKAALEAELDAEMRALSGLENILNDWLKQQER